MNDYNDFDIDGGNQRNFHQRGGGGLGENVSKQNLVHVTLSQIEKLTTKENNLVIYRQSIHSIITIGVVVSVEEVTTKNVYNIKDYTTDVVIEVQLWKNDKEDKEGLGLQTTPPTVMERSYLKVIGQVRYDDRKPFIVAYRVIPVEDPNEIYCHFLEVIQDSYFLELRMDATLNPKDGSISFSGKPNSTMELDSTASRTMSGFTEIQSNVLKVLNNYGRETCGLHRSDIKGYLSGVSSKAIDDAIQFLVDEGHIFTTTDENTFKSTDF